MADTAGLSNPAAEWIQWAACATRLQWLPAAPPTPAATSILAPTSRPDVAAPPTAVFVTVRRSARSAADWSRPNDFSN
jgi:hypothetical protein